MASDLETRHLTRAIKDIGGKIDKMVKGMDALERALITIALNLKDKNVCVPDPDQTENTVDVRAESHGLPQRVRDMNLNPAGPDRFA